MFKVVSVDILRVIIDINIIIITNYVMIKVIQEISLFNQTTSLPIVTLFVE